MKDLLKKPITFEKVEFWVATAIYVFSVYVLAYNQYVQMVTGDLHTPNVYLFREYRMPYSYSKDYFIPQFFINTTLYGCFLLLNFWIVKSLINGRQILLNIILLLLIVVLTIIILGTADTWIKSYLFHSHSEQYLYRLVFKQEAVFCLWALLTFGIYSAVKGVSHSFISNLNSTFWDNKQMVAECAATCSIFILTGFFISIHYLSWRSSVVWCEVIVYGTSLYWYLSYKIIPDMISKHQEFREYLVKVIVILFISSPFLALFTYLVLNRLNAAFYVNVFNVGVSLFLVSPFAWFLYQYRLSRNTELLGLKTELGRSSANLDFLRSQINPHFLFNALNTLYGTSLQENADRTGEGIQKLGDMMRFMLQENTQEKISLAREVDYLNNYIDLQKLRTQTSPDILIQTEIYGSLMGLEIAPMLLIPFVENAFKHGISLREPSHIKITLHTRENELLFDVYNSIHPKPGNDPEKYKSGIGLENVKQRLQLLYPKRFELVVRESAKEFFIHLTLQL